MKYAGTNIEVHDPNECALSLWWQRVMLDAALNPPDRPTDESEDDNG